MSIYRRLRRPLTLIMLAILFMGLQPLWSQATGRIVGRVIDGQTAEPMFGVAVFVNLPDGTRALAQSDFEGRFALSVPAGQHTVVFQMVSMPPRQQTVTVGAGATVNIAQTMTVAVAQEVTVRGRAINATEASMLQLQRNAGAVSDGISQEAIKRSPDSSASDALRRVTGITIVGGRFVFVRGLGERYSSTTLNDVPVVSPEPDKRVVPLDLFPAGLLRNIRVVKSFLPEDPGDFSGGVVKIETQEFPDEFFVSVGIGVGGNGNTTTGQFRTYEGGSTDWLGKDDGTRERPGLVASLPEFIPFVRGNIFGGLPPALVQLTGALFPAGWDYTTTNAPFDRDIKLAIGDSIETESFGRFGYLFGTSYNRNYRNRQSREVTYFPELPAGALFPEAAYLEPKLTQDVQRSTEEVLWGNNLNLSYEPINNQRIYTKTFYSRNSEKYVRTSAGETTSAGGLGDPSRVRTQNTGWIGREVLHNVLGGEHAIPPPFGERPHRLEWHYGYSFALRDEPNLTQQVWRTGAFDPFQPFFRTNSIDRGYRFYSETEDTERSFDASYELPFTQWGGLTAKFKFGGRGSKREKYFRSNVYTHQLPAGSTDLDVFGVPGDLYFSLPAFALETFRFEELVQTVDSYDANASNHAYFGQVDLPITAELRFIGGVRYEDHFQFIQTFGNTNRVAALYDPKRPGIGELRSKDTLPSANFVYKLTPDINLRLAYTETVNRPEFRDLSTFGFSPTFGGDIVTGNPTLKRAYFHNYDSRFEWYFSAEEYLGVGVFYKDISNSIERIGLASQGQSDEATLINGRQGYLQGLEFELRKELVDRLDLGANLFFIESYVELLPWSEFAVAQAGLLDATDVRRLYTPTSLEAQLVGQSPYVFNFQIKYGIDSAEKMSIALFYNLFGDRLESAGSRGAPDRVEKGAATLDAVFSWQIVENMDLKLAGKNLTDTRFKVIQENPLLDREEIVRSYRDGVSYSFSFGYKF